MLRALSALHGVVLGSSIGVGIETLQVWFVGVAYGCGYLGVALISHIVRMSRFVLDPPLIVLNDKPWLYKKVRKSRALAVDGEKGS